MRNFLLHHVGRTDLTGIANCHVRGLHSIMLHDQDGNRVRMYVTTDDIDTHSNYLSTDAYIARELGVTATNIREIEQSRLRSNSGMTLGLHRHSTDIRLELLAGSLYNTTAGIEENDNGCMLRYGYDSPITGTGVITREIARRYRPVNIETKQMKPGDDVYMTADQYHTIYVDRCAAWLVYERGPRTESNHFFSYNYGAHLPGASDMYRRMDAQECQALLARVISLHYDEETRKTNTIFRQQTHKNDLARLATAKSGLEAGRITTPSDFRAGSRAAAGRMATVAGTQRVANVLHLITNEDWNRWCNLISRREDDAGLGANEFIEWACARVVARGGGIVDSPAVAPAQSNAARGTAVNAEAVARASRSASLLDAFSAAYNQSPVSAGTFIDEVVSLTSSAEFGSIPASRNAQ